MPPFTRALPWLLRAAWVVLPFTAGGALGEALSGRSSAVRTTASVGLWLVWAVVLVVLLVPRPVGLTALRVAAPAALAASLATGSWLAGLSAGVACVLGFLPETGFLFVNGAAYGDERRHLLRPPGALLLGPLALAWVVVVAGVAVGPLLLAAGQVAGGVAALVAGWAAAFVAGRALHSLSNRWVVLVPAGLVLKDHLALLDPVLFRRGDVELLHPAPADTDALDLTVRSPGLALELRLREKVPLVVVAGGTKGGEPGRVLRLLFTPTRPGALLADAESRRIPVG